MQDIFQLLDRMEATNARFVAWAYSGGDMSELLNAQAVPVQMKELPPDHPLPYFCSAPGCLTGARWKIWGSWRRLAEEEVPEEWQHWYERFFCCQEHKISADPGQVLAYLAMRNEGTSHRLAEMFALQAPPMSNTDREFLEGRGGCYDQFQGSPQGEFYRQAALDEGFNPTGKVYLSGLAAYPGDPRAWVSGRGDVQRVCEERGWDCQGAVHVKAARFHDMAPPTDAVAADLVEAHTQRALEADPGLLEKPREEVREQVRERITPHWAGE